MSSINISNLSSESKNQIKSAIDSLNTIFKEQNFAVNDDRLIELLIDKMGGSDIFNEIYKESFNKTLDKYKDIGLKLDNMRSTFLPIELVREVKADSKGLFDKAKGIANSLSQPKEVEAIMDKKFFIESYENTFFRMLGMPTEVEVSDFIRRSYVDGKFYMASSELDPIQDQAIQIMNRRQTHGIRGIKIDKSIFAPSPGSTASEEAAPQGEASSEMEAPTEMQGNAELDSTTAVIPNKNDEKKDPAPKKVSSKDLMNISSNLYKTNYLLFPPLQDSRVSNCISEPEKFVSRPFMSSMFPRYNSEKTKTSLLESIIRIRLDKLSGYKDNQVKKLSSLGGLSQYSFDDVKNSYSFIESLMINRMYSALYFLSEKISENIEDYIKSSDYANLTVNAVKNSKPGSKTGDQATAVSQKQPGNSKTQAGKVQDDNSEIYRVIKSIDDTIALLLSSSETLNIQKNTFRTNSVANGQLMGIISSIVSTPGKYAESKFKEIEKNRAKVLGGKNGVDENISKISLTLGIGRGVGLLDFICFSLGLFLLKEEHLIGLLNQEQFSMLKSTYPTFNFFGLRYSKKSITESLNEYTKVVIGLYGLSEEIMADPNLNP